MARQNLVLCEVDDERVAAVMDRIYKRAAELRERADALAGHDTLGQSMGLTQAAKELEWAAYLLSGRTDGAEGG